MRSASTEKVEVSRCSHGCNDCSFIGSCAYSRAPGFRKKQPVIVTSWRQDDVRRPQKKDVANALRASTAYIACLHSLHLLTRKPSLKWGHPVRYIDNWLKCGMAFTIQKILIRNIIGDLPYEYSLWNSPHWKCLPTSRVSTSEIINEPQNEP